MADLPGFDTQQAHEYFSKHCFNEAWQLIDRTDRSREDNEQMIRLAHVSLWHWSQRSDCSDENLSIGYWQASRVYALVGQAENARRYAQMCLKKTPEDRPFYLGYAYEALARAESLAHNTAEAKAHLAAAWKQAEGIADEEDKKVLVDDLTSLESDL